MQKISEAIILAGGLGTRLRSAVADLPKCMAPVDGIPFIAFVIAYLQQQGITRFIFSLGYKSEVVTAYLQQQYPALDKSYIIEEEPLGTGGAVKLACENTATPHVLVVNGDTLFDVDITTLAGFHFKHKANCSLALKYMQHFSRYGSIEVEQIGLIKAFKEKQYSNEGYINGGIYVLEVKQMLENNLSAKFSFEKDFLEKYTNTLQLFGFVQDGYFIDIGIPEDYQTFINYWKDYKQKINPKQKQGWNMFASFINNIKEYLP